MDANMKTEMKMNGYLWRGGRMEEGKQQYRKTVESGVTGGLDIKFVTIATYPRCVGVTI